MRRFIFTLSSLVVMIFASCSNASLFVEKAKVYSDSVVIESDTVQVSISALLPKQENNAIAFAISEYVNEQLGGYYEDKYTDFHAMLGYYAKRAYEDMDTTRAEMDFEIREAYEYEANFSVAYENDKFITLYYTNYGYMGGAHGYGEHKGITLRKSDGRRVAWNMFSESIRYAMQDNMRRGLMEYFNCETPEELRDYLLNVEDADYIPLPEAAPLLLEDGVMFIYQEYELAPYAAGRPEFVISYDQLRPYLTTTLKRLIAD